MSTWAPEERIFVGVARVVVTVPGARSLKDRRRAVLALRDRLRHRFDVTVHEVDDEVVPVRGVLVLTTAGKEQRLIRSILDQALSLFSSDARVLLRDVDVDVFRWHPPGVDWTDPEE